MTYRFFWTLLLLMLKFRWRYQVRHADRVPRTGAVILASNHISNLDPPAVGCGFWRPCRFMAKEELFKGWFGKLILRLGAFPVKRGSADRAALKQALEHLEAGRALVMFPEGTRSPDGELQAPEIGVGLIACRSGANVIPCFVRGTDQALARDGKVSRATVSVIYGEPLNFATSSDRKPGREEYEAAARRIMEAIAALRDSRPD